MEIVNTTSIIANCAIEVDPEGAAARAAAEVRFWELYWGQLALVESIEVERAMVDFQEAIVVPSQSEAEKRDEKRTLQLLSFAVAHACRNSIAESWKVGLTQLSRPQYLKNADTVSVDSSLK
jgi:hypothetical protein